MRRSFIRAPMPRGVDEYVVCTTILRTHKAELTYIEEQVSREAPLIAVKYIVIRPLLAKKYWKMNDYDPCDRRNRKSSCLMSIGILL